MTPWHLLNGLLGLLLLLAVGVSLALRRDPVVPNWEFMPNMAHSARQNAFESSEAFPDGATLRTPPEGSIPRGAWPLGYGNSARDAIRAGRELVNPIPNDATAVARGGVVYERFCVTCHGEAGLGDGPVVERGVRRPPSLLRPGTRRMPDGQMFHIITRGQRTMGAYGAQVAPDDRWRVVHYVRALQAATPPEPAGARQ